MDPHILSLKALGAFSKMDYGYLGVTGWEEERLVKRETFTHAYDILSDIQNKVKRWAVEMRNGEN